jgi:hypothetical protein
MTTSLILRFMSRLRGLFAQGQANREFGEEVETHMELLQERLMHQGMSREDAASAARRQFGNTVLIEQRHREARSFLGFATVLQDVRYGLRMLAKSPGVTAIAITSLALGIGANTAIFTLAKAALFDALSVPQPGQLRLLAYAQDDRSVVEHDWGDFYTDAQGRTVIASFSYPVYQELRRRDHSLGDLFAFVDLGQFEHLSATIDGHAEVVTAELVSGNFFQGMGVGTALGRPIEPADDAVPGSGAVAVISDSFWQRRFDRSPSVIGKTVDVNLTPITIGGVAPRGFSGASHMHTPQDMFLPLSMQPVIFPKPTGSLLSDADTWWIQIMGRLEMSTSDEQARASLAVSLNQAIRSTMTVPADRSVPPLLLLPGGRGWNYAAQELEHPMPFLLGLTGLGFGVGPAWQATRTSVNAGLKDGGTTMTRHRGGIAGKMLVTLQISLCMLLLVGAGLFVRTLVNLNTLDPGFNKRGLLLFAIEPPVQRYPAPKNVEVLHRLEERLASLPGVESVTLSREALLAQSGSNSDFLLEGRPRIAGRNQHVPYNSVGQSFFATMGIPILYGRSFDLRDTPSSPGVAVINRALAQKEFGGTNPVGASFRMKAAGEQFEIVGVCADSKYAWIRGDDSPTFYGLYTQQKDVQGSMTFEVRTKGEPRDCVGPIRSAVESVDKDLPLIEVRTQEEQIDATLAPERSFATVTGGFGVLALVLACIGVYGVMAAGVSRRINEIGIRMALGARTDQVRRMVLGEAIGLALVGVGGGLCAALLLTRLLSSFLFGLKPTDSGTLAGAGSLLLTVAILASWGPARRASRIQPVQALRHE